MENVENGEQKAKTEGSPTIWQGFDEIIKECLSNGTTVKMIVDTLLRCLITYVLTELLTKKN